MKVIEEIIGLAREHHQTLVLANKCINTSNSNNADDIKNLCEQISKTFASDWQRHFEIEEEFIFSPLTTSNTDLLEMVALLKKEHSTLNDLANKLQSDNALLASFGALLQNHTRTEDRQLLPNLQKHLTAKQLKQIQDNY